MLRLSRGSLNQTQIGQVINLLSNDVSRFDLTPLYLHYIWIMPIQTILSAYFMYNIVGAAALGGILFIIVQAVPLQGNNLIFLMILTVTKLKYFSTIFFIVKKLFRV